MLSDLLTELQFPALCPYLTIQARQLLIDLGFFFCQPFRGNTAIFQLLYSLHIFFKLRFHTGEPFFVERLAGSQRLCVCQCRV